jgi:hypothetical protein
VLRGEALFLDDKAYLKVPLPQKSNHFVGQDMGGFCVLPVLFDFQFLANNPWLIFF